MTGLLQVIALSLLGARLVLSSSGLAFLPWAGFALIPIELAVVVLAARRVRAARRGNTTGGDVLTQLQSSCTMVFGSAIAGRAAGHEIASFHYAFARAPAPTSKVGAATENRFAAAPPFASSLFAAVLGVGTIETTVLHLLVVQHSSRVAWFLTALSIYAVIWLVGYQRSCGSRVSTLEPGALVLRVGLRCDATVPWDNIASVRLLTWRDLPGPMAGYLDAAKPSEPNVLLEFRHSVRVEGPYGIPRSATRLGVRFESPEPFVAEVAARLT